jgi:geranylgeranyl diphosphate synthase type II
MIRQTVEAFSLKSWWAERTVWVEEALERSLPADDPSYLGNVGEVMRYCLFSGGKRFRPILAIGAAEALGKPGHLALSAGCAYEMIHCFSLAHDDLPCMDDDDFRRGKPTTHKVYGEASALLAGDGLSIWAFYEIAKLPEGVPAEIGLRLVRDLALSSGHPGMVGGQVIDMEARTEAVNKEFLERIHRAKTGALICGAVRAGAMLGGADEAQLANLTRYGELVGLVFQMTDDILDAEEDPEEVSYPRLLGLDETKRLVRQATQEALDALSSFGPSAEPLRALATFLETREG